MVIKLEKSHTEIQTQVCIIVKHTSLLCLLIQKEEYWGSQQDWPIHQRPGGHGYYLCQTLKGLVSAPFAHDLYVAFINKHYKQG